MKGRFENISSWLKVIQWLGVMALLTIVAMGIWALVPCDHASTSALKWFQFVQTVGTFLLPPLICAWLWSSQPSAWLGLRMRVKGERKKNLFLLYIGAVLLMVVVMPGINLLADWNSKMVLPECMADIETWMKAQEDAAMALTERFLKGEGVGILLINIGLMALLPACAEELTFRGVIQGLIVESRKTALLKVESNQQSAISNQLSARQHVAVWVTAIIFSAIHLQFYGFVPRMLLGALFGYMLVWTGSLWVPIVMHFTNNCVTVVAYWVIYNRGINPETVESFGSGETAWVGWLSLALTATGIYFFWRLSRQISNASSRMSEGS